MHWNPCIYPCSIHGNRYFTPVAPKERITSGSIVEVDCFGYKKFDWMSSMMHFIDLWSIKCIMPLIQSNFIPPYISSSFAFIKRRRVDITWEILQREEFPYYVASGKSSLATCRACGAKLAKDELRIRFEVTRRQSRCMMPTSEVNVCMALSCVQNAYQHFKVKPQVINIRCW